MEDGRNTWYTTLPHTKIEQIKEDENMTTKPDTTKTV